MPFSLVVRNGVKADERTHGAGVVEGAERAVESQGKQKCLCLNLCPNVQMMRLGMQKAKGEESLQPDPLDIYREHSVLGALMHGGVSFMGRAPLHCLPAPPYKLTETLG